MTVLITPRVNPGVCPRCFNFTLEPAGQFCRACRRSPSHLAAVAPISYAPAGGQLHQDLADYKRAADPAVPHLIDEIARILSHHLEMHEACVAERAGVPGFDAIVAVPSGDARRDEHHPLRRIVSELPEVGDRFHDALRASGIRTVAHAYAPERFRVTAPVAGLHVLLIDDVWTTGASAQSAAAQLREAGVASVSAMALGRYVNGSWGGIDARLSDLGTASDPRYCVFCAPADRQTTQAHSRFLYSGLPVRGA
jgi:predicted amidophosphoribosyltransferase